MATDINRKHHSDSLRAVGTDLKQIQDENNNIVKIAHGVAEMAFSQALIVDGDFATKADIPKQPCQWHNLLRKEFDEHIVQAEPMISDWGKKQSRWQKFTDGFFSGFGSRLAWALVAGLIAGITVLGAMMIAFKMGNL